MKDKKMNNRIKIFLMCLITVIYFGYLFFDIVIYKYSLFTSGKDGHSIQLIQKKDILSKISVDNKLMSSPIALKNELLFQTQKHFSKVDIKTKKELWRYSIPASSYNSPPCTDGIVSAVPNSDYEINLLENQSGSLIWTSKINKSQKQNKVSSILDINIIDDYVIVARYSDGFYIVNKNTGEILHEYLMGKRDSLKILTYKNKAIFLSSENIQIVELSTGETIKVINGNFSAKSAYLYKEVLFVVNKIDGKIFIDFYNMETFDNEKSILTKSSKTGCISIVNNNLFFSSDGIEKFSLSNGNEVWSNFEVSDLSCVKSHENILYFKRIEGDLLFMNNETGHYVGRLNISTISNDSFPYSFDPVFIDDGIVIPIDEKAVGIFKFPNSE